MSNSVKLNGISLSEKLIGEIQLLQQDNGDLAKHHLVKLNHITTMIANHNNGGKQYKAEELLEFVMIISDMSQLLTHMVE